MPRSDDLTVAELADSVIAARSDVHLGLSSAQKWLPTKYLYDDRGSKLFEEICRQPEYYLTRTELQILEGNLIPICDAIGQNVRLVEFGSGSGEKTRLLLEGLEFPSVYVPVEISQGALRDSVVRLRSDFPALSVSPLCADFTEPLTLEEPTVDARRTVVFFPGSTIGNFALPAALMLLTSMRKIAGTGGGCLIGFDLKKDTSTLEAAYNDRAGVTAAFTLNMLTNLNRVAGTDFIESKFRHQARYEAASGRIETYLVSRDRQVVRLGDSTYAFEAGERMLVECSHKYAVEEFQEMARACRLAMTHVWMDVDKHFAVSLFASIL